MTPYYQDDWVTLYHGDCLEMMPQLSAVDFVVTDIPYNAGKKYGSEFNDRKPWPEWCAWLDKTVSLALDGARGMFSFLSNTAYRKYLRIGMHEPQWTAVWHKPFSMAACGLSFFPHWEPIVYWGINRKKEWLFGPDVLSYNVCRNVWGHPTEKPLRLMKDLISRTYGVVLDPFAGSGTTLRAAKELGRKAIGIEINEEYCEVIAERMAQDTLPFVEHTKPEQLKL